MATPTTPTCLNCNYDLTGLIEQGSSAACPECNASTTFAQATAPKMYTPTLKQALVWILAVPSGLMIFANAWLFVGGRSVVAVLAMLPALVITLFLPIYTPILLYLEWQFRKSDQSHSLLPSFKMMALIILACFIISMSINLVFGIAWLETIIGV